VAILLVYCFTSEAIYLNIDRVMSNLPPKSITEYKKHHIFTLKYWTIYHLSFQNWMKYSPFQYGFRVVLLTQCGGTHMLGGLSFFYIKNLNIFILSWMKHKLYMNL
jgi:hypothetical protein